MSTTTRNPALALAFGECVRALRESLGVAQEALALDAGMDRSYLGKVERGEKQPSLDIVFRLAVVLGLSPSELVEKVSKRVVAAQRRSNAVNRRG
jgi:XRE family transcriptional regulator, regulator of sulfur utilization